MISRTSGTVALLERLLDRPLLTYHCIIHKESLCGKNLNLLHAMISVVECANIEHLAEENSGSIVDCL